MKTLLRIDSSLRFEDSYSRKMGDFFIQEWQKLNPNGRIIKRDVTENQLPHLNQQTLNGFYDNSVKSDFLELSDRLIEEMHKSDEILITAPMYNFGIPSSLKVYFDLVVRTDKTFKCETESIGLLYNKKAYVISAMGAQKGNEVELNLVEIHLREILTFIGISEIYYFTIDGTANKTYAQKMLTVLKSNFKKILNQ